MKRMLIALVVLLPLPALAQGSGPSFDCGRARAWDERQICAQADLAELDRRIAAAWRAAADRATPDQRAQLQAQQRAWLAERRGCEGPQLREAQSCLRRAMRARVRDLEAAVASGGAGTSSSAATAGGDKPPPAPVPVVTALAAVTCPAAGGWAAPRICATPGLRDLDAAVVRDAAAARTRFASQPLALTEIEALLARYVADREGCARAPGRVPVDCLQETMEEIRVTLRQRVARG